MHRMMLHLPMCTTANKSLHMLHAVGSSAHITAGHNRRIANTHG